MSDSGMSGWQYEPFVVEVKAGEIKAFCMCGLSKTGPFCDGSHVTTDKLPEIVTFEEDKTVYVCGCQQSGNRPYCDGTHMTLSD